MKYMPLARFKEHFPSTGRLPYKPETMSSDIIRVMSDTFTAILDCLLLPQADAARGLCFHIDEVRGNKGIANSTQK